LFPKACDALAIVQPDTIIRWHFLRNHADGIAAIDLFVVPTISFRLLYCLLIVGHGRRQILWFGVTSHPTAEWTAFGRGICCDVDPDEVSAVEPDDDEGIRAGRNRSLEQ
jgi:hypothetical protein